MIDDCYVIKFIKEKTCIMLTKNDEYIDSIFFSGCDYEYGNLTMQNVEIEASKLAAIHDVDEYLLDITRF